MAEPRGHSPLGGSGAYRWMACPGSPTQSAGVSMQTEYAGEGSAAHALFEHCELEGKEPWELVGYCIYQDETGHDWDVTSDMAVAVQSFISCLGTWHPVRNDENSWVELPFYCPSIHLLFYGASDFVLLEGRRLHVWDYKHGQGIVVDVEENTQLMYYGCGVLESLGLWDHVDEVVLHIYQPRAWHQDGAHRSWMTSAEHLDRWLAETLVPAMHRAATSTETKTGEHCRFCPALRTECPALLADLQEYAELVLRVDAMSDSERKKLMTPEMVGRIVQLNEINKMVLREALKRSHQLLSNGKNVPGLKLVNARTNRVFKGGAKKAARRKFGDRAMTIPELKSPSQIEELPGGKEFTARWAYKPQGKTTVVVEGDPRRTLRRDAKSLFKPTR